MTPPTVTAYVAVGSNLGDRRDTIERAVDLLQHATGVEVTTISSLIENAAVGAPPDSPPFLNGAVELQTTLSAERLLELLLNVEQSLGRVRRERWASRTIDLDLLLYGDSIIHNQTLTVPHPRIAQRRFVLVPLLEISPQLRLPTGERIADLLAQLND